MLTPSQTPSPRSHSGGVSRVSPGASASLNSRYPLRAQVPVSPRLLPTLTLCFSTAAPGPQMNVTGLGRPGARVAGVK